MENQEEHSTSMEESLTKTTTIESSSSSTSSSNPDLYKETDTLLKRTEQLNQHAKSAVSTGVQLEETPPETTKSISLNLGTSDSELSSLDTDSPSDTKYLSTEIKSTLSSTSSKSIPESETGLVSSGGSRNANNSSICPSCSSSFSNSSACSVCSDSLCSICFTCSTCSSKASEPKRVTFTNPHPVAPPPKSKSLDSFIS